MTCRSTIQFFYARGPRVAIKSPLSIDRVEQEIHKARAQGIMLKLESLPDNPRENDGSSMYVYFEMDGIAWISVKEEVEKPSSLIAP